jgi:EmrB/QacA subfamily drug resistance transporter
MSATIPAARGRPQVRPDRLAWSLVLGGLLVVLDVTVMNVAIPHLSRAFEAPLPRLQWVSTAYTLALAAVLPTMAWAVGRWGGRRVYLGALVVFVCGSLAAALAWNLGSLVAARVVQGVGGALVVPTAMALVMGVTPPGSRGRVLAILGVPVLIGPALGPVFAGWALDHLSWRWIFLVNVPLGALAILTAARSLPPSDDATRRRLDVPGLLLLPPGLAMLVLALATSGEHATAGRADVVVPLVLGLSLLAGFVAWSRRAAAPLLDLGLLRDPGLASTCAVLFLFCAAYFGSMFLVPLYYQVVRGESATVAGLLVVPSALATGTSMQIAGRLIDRVPARRVVICGLGLAATGFASFALLLGPSTPYAALVACLVVAGCGVGATTMPAMTAATRGLPGSDLAGATSLLNVSNQTASSFGFAATSVALATRFDAHTATAAGLARGVRDTYLLPVLLLGLALLAAAVLLPRPTRGLESA